MSHSASDELAGVSTWDEAADLGAVEAYGRHLQHRDPREQFRRSKSGLPPETIEEVEKHQIAFDHVVLGGVAETDTLAHALYRRYWGEHDGSLHVLTCRKSKPGWRVEMSTDWNMALSNFTFAEVFEDEEVSSPEERTDGV